MGVEGNDMIEHSSTDEPSNAAKRPIVIVSRVFVVYPWRYRNADDPSWFERRMDLMKRITLPALARVRVPFVWVWLVHRTKMELVAEYMTQIDLQGFDVRLVDQRDKARDDIWQGVDKFLTVRVDTDDAWLPSAIDGLATRTLVDRRLVDFPRGVVLDWASGEMLHRNLSSYQGPFLAVTQGRDLMLDTGGPHRKATAGRTVEHVDAISWIQVVHGGNAENRLPPRVTKGVNRRKGPNVDGAPVDPELHDQILAACGIWLDPRQRGLVKRS
jgi:hypothetical protein